MRRLLIVGGANGIGLSLAVEMVKRDSCEIVYIVDKDPFPVEYENTKIKSFIFDLKSTDYAFFDQFSDIDSLMITAGFGRLSLFQNIAEQHIINSFTVNTIAPIRIIHHFMHKLQSSSDFYCGIMVSIAGFLSSPFFAVYGATKAALKIFIESVNVELTKNGSTNRILNVSPGAISGTSFNDEKTDILQTKPLCLEIIKNLELKNDLFIPKYEEIFKSVLDRYHNDFRAEGNRSYDYKLLSGRIK